MQPGRIRDSTKKSLKIFSTVQINMKCQVMSRNRGVHETGVSSPSPNKGQKLELARGDF